MDVPDARRYLRVFVGIAICVLTLVVMFNVAVDPYKVILLLDRLGVTYARPLEQPHARVHKPFYTPKLDFSHVVFGNSQVERGIDPAYPMLRQHGIRLYNFGLGGATTNEMAAFFQHLAENKQLDTAIIFLDFPTYGLPVDQARRGKTAVLQWNGRTAWFDFLRAHVSFNMARDSLETVLGNFDGRVNYEHRSNGIFGTSKPPEGITTEDQNPGWDRQETHFVTSIYQRTVQAHSELRVKGFDHSSLRAILRTARQYKVNLIIALSPRHARQWEALAVKGLHRLWEQWKAEIACVVADEEKSTEQSPVPVWDFADYSKPLTEGVPRANERFMYWWDDSVHFSVNLGNLMLDRIFRLGDPQFDSVRDFGTVLAPPFTEQLARTRRQRAEYLAKHPAILQQFRLMNGQLPVVATSQQGDLPVDCKDVHYVLR